MSKNCETCGRFMSLTNLLPDDDAFDMDLAIECGLLPEDERDAFFDFEGKWSRFHYVQEQWECDYCHTLQWHVEGPRYYWNPTSGNYDGQKPKTPRERAIEHAKQLEAAGQLRLFP